MGHLKQREGIAARLDQYPVAHPLVERRGDDRCEKLARTRVRQPPQSQLRESGGQLTRPARITGCEQQDNGLSGETTSHEREDLRRGLVQPLDVIDNADQRALLRRVGQQAEDGQPDQEAIGLYA